jgi:hypothetical protein
VKPKWAVIRLRIRSLLEMVLEQPRDAWHGAPGALAGNPDARLSAVVDTMRSLSNSICAAFLRGVWRPVFQVVIRSKTTAPMAKGGHPT